MKKNNEYYAFRNQVIMCSEPISDVPSNFIVRQRSGFYIYFDCNIPVIEADPFLFLGWAWDCSVETLVARENLEKIDSENAIQKTADFSGRYLLLVNECLFTDATSSFSVFYDQNSVSTLNSRLVYNWGVNPTR